MKRFLYGVLTVGVNASAPACGSNPPPAARAAAVERVQCDSQDTIRDGAAIVRSTKVLHVEPLYSQVASSDNSSEQHVNGAKLLIRPPAGVTAEQLTRLLQCHSARVLLGQADSGEIPNDPYWLPAAWVNIDVKSEDGNFLVTVSADSVRESLEVFGRANHYADQHMLATDPGLP
jgi:hypothetical protein